MQTLPIDSKSYTIFTVKAWKGGKILDYTEFNKDAKLFKNVKSNINRYYNKNNIKLELIINQIIILQNQFEPLAVARILFFLIDKKQHPILISLLAFLKIYNKEKIPEMDPNTKPDLEVYKELVEIYSP